MPGDIRSFFGGISAKNPASPKPPAAPEAKADVAMVDLTDDPRRPRRETNAKHKMPWTYAHARPCAFLALSAMYSGAAFPFRSFGEPEAEDAVGNDQLPPKKNRKQKRSVRSSRETRRVFLSIPPRVV